MKTLCHLRKMQQEGEKIAILTAYDASFARILSQAGIDILLVGDSLGSVIAGYQNTVQVTLDDIEYHTRCVVRGNQGAFIMADLPFMTYSNPQQALDSAARLVRAGAAMVKLEGGAWLAETVQQLTQKGIPVCAHVGLTAQYIHALGGHKVQGRSEEQAEQIIKDAKALQSAGASMMLIECVPENLAGQITEELDIPTIGIGAGRYCSGQVLVTYDMIGISGYSHLTFTKDFLQDGQGGVADAISAYVRAVKEGSFPAEEHKFA